MSADKWDAIVPEFEGPLDDFLTRIINVLHAVEADPTLLDDLDIGRLGDRTETDLAAYVAVADEMGRDE